MRDSLIDPTVGSTRHWGANVPPEQECRFVIDDSDGRSALERWLLNWSPDSDAYASGRVAVEKRATFWLVRFRDQRTGRERKVMVPVVGTPPPPGWKDKHDV